MKIIIFGANEIGSMIASQFHTANDITVIDEEKNKLDVVIASNTKIDKKIAKKYYTEEQKDPVPIDHKRLKELGVELIEDDLIIVEDNILRHNSLKLSSLIFSYLMRD